MNTNNNLPSEVQAPFNEAENSNESETPEQRVERLSELPILDRYLIRIPESGKLGISPAELDKQVQLKLNANTEKETEEAEEAPKPQLMDPLKMALIVKMTLEQFTVLELEELVAITLWVMFTWLHKDATVSPILFISSPEKRCGKSTLLSVLMKLCCNHILASNITPAALFRVIEQMHPTLIIDEADTFMSVSEELRGIINAGHYPDTAYVMRCSGDLHEPTNYSTWCAKVIAAIGQLPETIMDRSIIIEMKRKLPGQNIESIRRADKRIFEAIREQLGLWADSVAENFKHLVPGEIPELNDRANDNWEPLLGIADILGGDWPERARQAALKLSISQEDTLSDGEQLLTDITEVLSNFPAEKIATTTLRKMLCQDEEMLWKRFDRGTNITAAQLSKMLKPFNIKSTQIRIEGKQIRGYYLSDFTDAVERYVPQNSVTGVTGVTTEIPEATDL